MLSEPQRIALDQIKKMKALNGDNMPMIGFSIPDHVLKIRYGIKKQTTRKPRKSPLKSGDLLVMYYIPRMKKGTCKNCVNVDCYKELESRQSSLNTDGCEKWTNLLGRARVTRCVNIIPNQLSLSEISNWSTKDGFDTLLDADRWFMGQYGPEWWTDEWNVIEFELLEAGE